MSSTNEFPAKPVLDGTVALVTGASSGIGAATAAALAAQGAAVALAARRADRLEAVAAGIRDQGGTALVLESDITDQRQAAGAVERTVSELGRLDTLINNAGVMLLGPAADAPLTEWQQMVQLNVLGLLYCAHAALPHLLHAAADGPRQAADMVNISSVAGRVARNGNGVYSLTKHGVGAFSESLRQELAPRYVRVSLVEPGATATELADHNRPEVLNSIRSQFGQRMEADDIADAIVYIVTRPRHVAVNEILIRPTEQQRLPVAGGVGQGPAFEQCYQSLEERHGGRRAPVVREYRAGQAGVTERKLAPLVDDAEVGGERLLLASARRWPPGSRPRPGSAR